MTDKKVTVTVVIPAYNEEKLIPHALKSLEKQTVQPDEIIVADNNSTDSTPSIARSYGARVVPVKEQGYVFAFDQGTKAAKGEVIAMLDADTVASPTWIETLHDIFSDPKVVGATGSISIHPLSILSTIKDFLYSAFLVVNFALGQPHMVGFNMAMRKSALEKIHGVNTVYIMGPDVEIGLRLKKVGKVVYRHDMNVIPSMRRVDKHPFKTFKEYSKSYIYTIWLRKPAMVKQSIIR